MSSAHLAAHTQLQALQNVTVLPPEQTANACMFHGILREKGGNKKASYRPSKCW